MPEVSALRAQEELAAAARANEIPSFNIPLYLPSSLPLRFRPASSKLRIYEFRLRRAQAYEALEELRRHLRLRTHMWHFKDRNVAGQRANTRSLGLLTRTQTKVAISTAKYVRARAAVLSLAQLTQEVGQPDPQLKELKDEDVRAFADDTDKLAEAQKTKKQKQGLGEGKKKLSWIWKVVGVAEDTANEGLQEGTHCLLYNHSRADIFCALASTSHRMVQDSCPRNAMV